MFSFMSSSAHLMQMCVISSNQIVQQLRLCGKIFFHRTRYAVQCWEGNLGSPQSSRVSCVSRFFLHICAIFLSFPLRLFKFCILINFLISYCVVNINVISFVVFFVLKLFLFFSLRNVNLFKNLSEFDIPYGLKIELKFWIKCVGKIVVPNWVFKIWRCDQNGEGRKNTSNQYSIW